MKSAALIFNPRAGRWRTAQRIESIRRELAGAGFDAVPMPTAAPGHATELAARAVREGAEVVFAHGGDGTLREAAAALVGSTAALAPIPGGTVNVMAIALGIPQDPIRAARGMADVEILHMDAGLCGEEIFLMQTSAGLDAHVMGRLGPRLKRRFGKAAVAWSALLHFPTYPYPEIDLVADGSPLRASLVAICNLPLYAGSWKMAPDASISDRALDLVSLHGRGRRATLGFARDLVRGRHLQRTDVALTRVHEVELRGPADLAVQLDGDTLPIRLPVSVGLHPETLRVLAARTRVV